MDTINIMVLEDNEDDRYFIKKTIVGMGRSNYKLYESEKDFYAELDKEIHVCVLDHYVGDRTGLQILKDIKENNRGSFVIVYTGVRDENIIVEYTNSGVDRFVGKWQKNHLKLLEEYIKQGLKVAKGNIGFINYLLSRNFKIND